MSILMLTEPCILCNDAVRYLVRLADREVSIEQDANEIVELTSVEISDNTELSRVVGWIKATALNLEPFAICIGGIVAGFGIAF